MILSEFESYHRSQENFLSALPEELKPKIMWNKKAVQSFIIPTLSRELILKRYVLKLLGSLKDKYVLELGCGSGYWTRIFHARGAICTGVDISNEQIKLAKSLSDKDITYIKHDAGDFVSSKKFDIVFIDHIISETRSPKKIIQIFKSAKSLLRKEGFIVLNEMHPSVANFPFKNMVVEKRYYYFKSGTPIIFRVKQQHNKHIKIKDYHWTLQDFSGFLHKTGFVIDEIIEPRFMKSKLSNSYLSLRNKFPSHIIIKATQR